MNNKLNPELEEVKRLLRESEIENLEKEKRLNSIPVIFKQIKRGILVFTIFHFLFEFGFSYFTENYNLILPATLANYLISISFSKSRLENDKISKSTNYFNYGIKVSSVVFLVRLILGLVFIFFLNS